MRLRLAIAALLTLSTTALAATPTLLSPAYAEARLGNHLDGKKTVLLYRTGHETVQIKTEGGVKINLHCTQNGLLASGARAGQIDLNTFREIMKPIPLAETVQALAKVGVQADQKTGRVTLQPADVLRCEGGHLWTKRGAVGTNFQDTLFLKTTAALESPLPLILVRRGEKGLEIPPTTLEMQAVIGSTGKVVLAFQTELGSSLREVRLTQDGKTQRLNTAPAAPSRQQQLAAPVPFNGSRPYTLNFVYAEDKAGKDLREVAITFDHDFYTTWVVR